MPDITLWGFNGSTYVRTIRMILAEKGVVGYQQVPINVLEGEPRNEDHLARHPFGKVPVVDVDDFRIIETGAIARYLDAVLPGPSLIPDNARDVARMDMTTSIIDSYGYGAMIGGVAAYHLFPDFVGGRDDAKLENGLVESRKVLGALMGIKGASPYLAGHALSVADFYLAPIVSYLALTPHFDELRGIEGVGEWWSRISAAKAFAATTD